MVWAFFRCSAARDRRPRGREASAAAACASAGVGRTAFFPQGIGDLLQDVARIHAAVQLGIARAVVCGHRHVENAFDKNTGLYGRTLLPAVFRMSAAGTAAAAFPAAAGPTAAAFTAAALAAAAFAAGAVSLASPEHKLTQTFRRDGNQQACALHACIILCVCGRKGARWPPGAHRQHHGAAQAVWLTAPKV